MENKRRIQTLLVSYLRGSLPHVEHAELFTLIDRIEETDLQELITDTLDSMEESEPVPAFVKDRVAVLHQEILAKIHAHPCSPKQPAWSLGRALSAIAAAIVVLVSLTYIFVNRWETEEIDDNRLAQQAILPASMKGIMSIDGLDYELTGEKGGLVLANDSVAYGDGSKIAGGIADKTITINTPFGGHYYLTLGDGSKVWLNAGSTLSFSSGYNQKERRVKLLGEGYFEVENQEDTPFIVESAGQEVRVLGTRFNINAYPNENTIRTTLSAGALSVRTKHQDVTLQPDQQALVDAGSQTIGKISVDASAFTDWKEGIINLHGVNLAECMRMIARWYDLEVIFTGDPPDIQLGGKMSTGVSLYTFLRFLKENFQVEAELTDQRTLYIGRTK